MIFEQIIEKSPSRVFPTISATWRLKTCRRCDFLRIKTAWFLPTCISRSRLHPWLAAYQPPPVSHSSATTKLGYSGTVKQMIVLIIYFGRILARLSLNMLNSQRFCTSWTNRLISKIGFVRRSGFEAAPLQPAPPFMLPPLVG